MTHPAPPGEWKPDDWDASRGPAEKLLVSVGRSGAEISVVLCDDEQIHRLNHQWRGYDKPTDVLSWPQETDPRTGEPDVLGDVVISLDTARRQAHVRQWSLGEEVGLLLLHGTLHLLGYEDETEAGAEAMRDLEVRFIGKPLEKTSEAAEV